MSNNTADEYYSTPKKNLSSTQNIFFKNFNSTSNSSLYASISDVSTIDPVKRSATGSFLLLPFVHHTPPSAKLKKVINPFEHALTDRLHLPLICSPSLFKPPPSTPKNSSKEQFEWTIEDVSSLTPANLEPYETQFIESSPDPEVEARAQAAIRSYFKEQLVVPSPQIVSSIQTTTSTTISLSMKSKKEELIKIETKNNKIKKKTSLTQRRNITTQTMLSFPPKLPKKIEKILNNYLKTHINLVDIDQKENSQEDEDSREVSRKLFDSSINSIENCDNTGNKKNEIGNNDDIFSIKTPEKSPVILKCHSLSPSLEIKTPDLMENLELTKRNSGINFSDTSFGNLSPISNLSERSSKLSQKISEFRENEKNFNFKKQMSSSPSTSSSSYKSINESIIIDEKEQNYEFNEKSFINMSVDISLNNSQLELSSKCSSKKRHSISTPKHNNSRVLRSKSFAFNEIDETIFNSSQSDSLKVISKNYNLDDDEMQISQISSMSSSSPQSSSSASNNSSISQNHPVTPIKKRYPSKKNLSHSFSYRLDDYYSDNDDFENKNEVNNKKFNYNKSNIENNKILENNPTNSLTSCSTLNSTKSLTNAASLLIINNEDKLLSTSLLSSQIYRTDSGFNEITATSSYSLLNQDESKIISDLKQNCELLDYNNLNFKLKAPILTVNNTIDKATNMDNKTRNKNDFNIYDNINKENFMINDNYNNPSTSEFVNIDINDISMNEITATSTQPLSIIKSEISNDYNLLSPMRYCSTPSPQSLKNAYII